MVDMMIEAETSSSAPQATEPTETEETNDPSSEAGFSLDEELTAKFDEVTNPEEIQDPPDGEEQTSNPETEVEQSQEIVNAIDPPVSWSSDMKAKFVELPSEAQEYIAKRESEAHAAIVQLGNEVKQYEPLSNVLGQYDQVFKVNNLNHAEGVQRLLEVQSLLDNNPIEGVKQIAKAYNVDLEDFAFEDFEDNAPQITSMQNEIAVLKQQLAQQSKQSESVSQMMQQQVQQEKQSLVESFSKDKPHFDKLQNEIATNLQAIDQSHPNLSDQEALSKAYEMALWQNPETRAEMIAKQAELEKAKEDEKVNKAKKASKVNVKSSSNLEPGDTDLDSTLGRVFDKFST